MQRVRRKVHRFGLRVLIVLLGAALLPAMQAVPAQAVTPGYVVGWGNNRDKQSTVPANLASVTAISAATGHSLEQDDVAPAIITQPSDQTANAGSCSPSFAAVSTIPVVTVVWDVSTDNGRTWYDVTSLGFECSVSSENNGNGSFNTQLSVFATADKNGYLFRALFINAGGSTLTNAAMLTVNADNTPPDITPSVVGTAGSNGWYIGDVNVTWSVVDKGSAVTSQTGCDPQSITADTTGTTITCSATSAGGTSSKSVTIQRDATPPTVVAWVTPNPASLNLPAFTNYSFVDLTSGLAAQGCTEPDTTSTGSKSVSCTVTDGAGNTTTKSASYTVVNNPPTISVAPGGTCADGNPSGSIKLTVGDVNTGPNGLTLRLVSNSNTQIVPNSGVVLGGSGANRTLGVTATPKKSGTAKLTIEVSDGANTTNLDVTVVAGGNGITTVAGTPGPDILFGGNAVDTLNGQGGIDLLCGGNGNDTLNGGDGNDTIFGNRGDDVLTGGSSADFFSGGQGTDTATDFTPSQGDTKDNTVEKVTTVAAAGTDDSTGADAPALNNWLYLPSLQK